MSETRGGGGGGRQIRGNAKVTMLIRELCCYKSGCKRRNNKNADRRKLQRLLGKRDILPAHVLLNPTCHPTADCRLSPSLGRLLGLMTQFVHGECFDRQSISRLSH